MRNLNDINDLYNVQDVILFLELVENRFEQMYKKYYYNPRKWNLASTLSGCTKIIMALPASSGNIEIFEKTLTDSFRCVNTMLDFEKKNYYQI